APTKANIERQLGLVLSLAAENDLVVVAFAGHGVHLDGASYLCPVDGQLDRAAETLVPMEVVYSQLERSKASFKLLILDACRNDPRPPGRRALDDKPDASGLATTFVHPPRGILVLSSCAPGQYSFEDRALKHGVFTNYLLEGLAGSADANHNGR